MVKVLFEDNHLLVLEKPPGVPSQGDPSGDASLLDLGKLYLKDKYQKPGQVFLGLVHRLDRPTGGVMVFARTSKAASRLSEQFRERKVRKTYLALCLGHPQPQEQTLVHFLLRRSDQNRMQALDKTRTGAKRAELSFEVMAQGEETSLLRVSPRTGRRHQIRVQLARVGHPLLGDVKYGRGSGPRDKLVKAIGLWAHGLEFEHPIRREQVDFWSVPPLEPNSLWFEYHALFRKGRTPD